MEVLKSFGLGNFVKELNKIIDTGEKVLIPGQDGKNLVVLSEKEYLELAKANESAE